MPYIIPYYFFSQKSFYSPNLLPETPVLFENEKYIMKKLLLSTFLLFLIIGFTKAQPVAVVVTGQVTDTLGNPIPNYPVLFYQHPASTQTTFTNQNGYYTDSLSAFVLDTITIGIVDCDSSFNSALLNVQGAGDTLIADFIYCGSNTVNCGGYFNYTSSNLTAQFNAVSISGGPYNWFWSFLDGSGSTSQLQNPTHTFPAPGSYGVILTASNFLCSFTYFDTVVVSIAPPTFTIAGRVYKNGIFDGATQGFVALYSADSTPAGGAWNLLGTVNIDSGWYFIPNLNPGDYYTQAVLTSQDPDFANYNPTYYTSALNWAGATVINIGSSVFNADIDLLPLASPLSGNGNINGIVVEGGRSHQGEGDPIEDVQVQLWNSLGNPMAVSFTDANGNFDFLGIDFGVYQVKIEYPGLPHAAEMVNLTAGTPNKDFTFIVNSNAVVLTIGKDDFDNKIVSYPNPVNDLLVIKTDRH